MVPTHVQQPHHTDFHPSRNVFLASWFILSVLFLTGGEMSVAPTRFWDPQSQGPTPWYECLLDKPFHSVCVIFDRWWDVCGPYTCPISNITQTYTPVVMSSSPAGSFCLCCF